MDIANEVTVTRWDSGTAATIQGKAHITADAYPRGEWCPHIKIERGDHADGDVVDLYMTNDEALRIIKELATAISITNRTNILEARKESRL